MRSRLVACVSSRRSASPRVPTREKARSRRSAAKSSQAAMHSRLWVARSSASRRRQAGSTLRNVYLTNWRSGISGGTRIGEERLAVPNSSPGPHRIANMRVALVSPYSWTYPGGVTRHIEALRADLDRAGHDVTVFAPFDFDRRRTALAHRGARPQVRSVPEWLVPLGPTIGWPTNGAVSNLAPTPYAVSTLRRELRAGGFDVVHLHEPVAPVIGWDALTSTDAPLVGTFHCYSESVPPHAVAALLGARPKINHLSMRIAVSEAAAWTGRRFYGGRYVVIPNGVVVPAEGVAAPVERAPGAPLRIAFVGQAVERKGLPVLLRAFEALRREVPAELIVIGSTAAELEPLLVESEGIIALGRVDDAAKEAALRSADLLCAPSLGGESFGMVLTE